jgi:thiosulfate/3-mercaptopyruvate sulfurtransferase
LIQALQEGRIPEGHKGGNTVICHAHYRNPEAYLTGHIPGAIGLDTIALEAPETWNRRSPKELKAALEQHGITANTTVILYGKYMDPDNSDEFPGSAAGHIGAIRSAFIMAYAGVQDVRVLNGGFQSWKDEGLEISTEEVERKPVKDFGASIPANPELAVDTPEARDMIRSQDADLVCVRSYPEYVGEVSGYNYIQKKGRIPGALFANCGSDAYHMENYRNLDHTTREYHEIAEIWRNSGITPDKRLAFYCGTGWRGSEAWFNAWIMGWPKASVYDGGWFEWSSDPANPTETGE